MRRLLVAISIVVFTVPVIAQSQSQKKPSTTAKRNQAKSTKQAAPIRAASKPDAVAQWFLRTFAIDVRAYLTLTAVRGAEDREPGSRLAVYDRQAGKESTLWECGACWSPVRIGEATAVLRIGSGTSDAAELWIVDRCGARRAAGPFPTDALLIGTVMEGGSPHVVVAMTGSQCSTESTYRLVSIDVETGTTSEIADAGCVGRGSLTNAGRLYRDEVLSTTSRRDLQGHPIPRKVIVLAPATAEKPDATLLMPNADDGIDRIDPIWAGAVRVIYAARP